MIERGDRSAWPTGIDLAAPVVSRRSCDIAARLETIWSLHTDVGGWSEWQMDISHSRIDGVFAPGGRFSWQTKGIDAEITSQVYAIEPGLRTLWGGLAQGIMGIHEWQFEAVGPSTRVTTGESWSGEPLISKAPEMQEALDTSLERWLRFLKLAAERREHE